MGKSDPRLLKEVGDLCYISWTQVTLIKEIMINLIMDKFPASEPQPSYVKLAMRNMVRKGGTSLKHFALTAVGLLSVLVGLAYLTR